nr:RHS repeat-associated core domain-containing protein [Luteimonas sp. BDR2-5]
MSSWYRGIPRNIQYPGGSTQSAVVSAAGWITSVTDETGAKTCYAYNPMGRVNRITYPSETQAGVCDTSQWAATTIDFGPQPTGAAGLPAGYWRQDIATGNYRKHVYHDALWRPVVVREHDQSSVSATTRFTRYAYDHAGRVTFASYPGTSHNLTTGTWSEYDALGRPTSVSQDSELGLLTTATEYLSNFRTRVTSPKGAQTTTTYLAWDQPTTDYPVAIAQSGGVYTHITRDAFGKPTQLRRSNSSNPTGGSVGVNRSYTYNANQELCRSVDPENGATLMGYDGAGNLAWSAAGLPAETACHAAGNTGTINPRKVTRSYDGRNRLTALSFANGIGNQAWTYTPDGLPATIVTHNTSGGTLVTNAYSYNRRRLLTGESVKRGTAAAWSIGYGYNGNGHPASLVYPSGLTVNHAPNALGQPTQAGTFASGVNYFPNGAIKSFTYGNGIVHTLTQNARGLPLRSTDCTTTGTCAAANRRLDLQYGYDQHGNVTGITDHTSSGRQTRGMSYDVRDRLVQTTSGMFGTASYAYSVLDNLTTVSVSGGSQSRNHTYTYDTTTRRLSQVKNTVGGAVVANLTYDVQGNLAGKGAQTYQFDLGNRLRSVPGRETGYEYDGHGRRVHAQTVGSSQILSQYGNAGQLLYQQDHKQAKRIDYIYLGSSLVAFRERPLTTATETVKYQHTDALGTPIAVTNATKATIETGEYEPYGQLVNKVLPDGPGFTGHVQDAATGLTYMQQRYYDPQLGVFLSVDPITAYGNPIGAFNRYRYAANNPYKFVDPDGRDIKCASNTCQLVPIGGNLPTVNFPRPKGFPASISERDSFFHHVYRFTDSAGSGDGAYSQRLNEQLVSNPTPMQDEPATLQGNKIDVNANNAISRLTGQDNVMSYQIPLQNGTSAVLNVTTGNHAATWGIVLRLVQPGQGGEQNIVTYGEGNSFLQRVFDPDNNQSREVWSRSAEEISRRARP